MRRRLLGALLVIGLAGAAAAAAAWAPWSAADPVTLACSPNHVPPEGKLDLRRTLGEATPAIGRFDYESLYVATEVDSILSLDRPCFDEAKAVGDVLPDTSLVLGLERGGEAKAYPVDLLSLHEIVNDVVGGDPVAITWCPLCQSGVAYERDVSGETVTFGVSGYLYRANLMLFDRESGSLWNQILGAAVTGPHRGRSLERIPVVHETWARWKARHPDTRVLSIARDPLGRQLTDPYAYSSTGNQDSNVPYSWYVTKAPVYHGRTVRGVSDGSRVYGVVLGGEATAFPVPAVWKAGVAHEKVGGTPVLAVYNAAANSVDAFSRRVGDRELTFGRRGSSLVDRETGTTWSAATGIASAGPLEGKALARLPTVSSYWFAWRRVFPDASVWSATRR